MDDALLNLIMDRLGSFPLPGDASALLLAALDGEETLRTGLDRSPAGDAPDRPEPDSPEPGRQGATGRAPVGSGVRAAGTYLRSIVVRGFRGIGATTTLQVEPGPGLTLIVGRNGSGKSSFAEALEVLLTGDLRRWSEHRNAAVARDGWRNLHERLHEREHTEVAAEFVVEGAGAISVRRIWPPGGGFGESVVMWERGADPGWDEALITYRPFLAHSELEAFFQEPSRVYDLLLSVLGMDSLITAAGLLASARKEREAAAKAVSARLPGLCAELEAADDERATACRAALIKRHPDPDQVLALAASGTSTGEPASDLNRLRLLAQLSPPPEAELGSAITELREAAADVEAHHGSAAGRALALAGLLGAALRHHGLHGDGGCPVCGSPGALTGRWRARAETEVSRLRAEATAAQVAHHRADAALSRVRELIVPAPGVMTGSPVSGVDAEAATAAWSAWSAVPEGHAGLRALADHLERRTPPLVAAVTELSGRARAELRRREDRWAPVAARVAAWCDELRRARSDAAPVAALKAAETWLQTATDDIRNARLAPLADRSRAIWSLLRQESNVDLGSIRLNSSSTRRHATVEVTVDGTPGVALGVMSQGEINALALSIFIPRATLPASPFRFLIIDDPVQAMDPAKVDGLARVLSIVARSRQVIVFTHDDRLATAVRRLEIDARIVEVTRRPGSVIETRPSLDPVERQLKDAMALCMDQAVPVAVAARVVPGLCRTAVEAAFTEAIWRVGVRTGRPYREIEASIESARETKERAALALFGDRSRRKDVIGQLAEWNRGAATTFKQLNGSSHLGHNGQLRSLVDRTRYLTGVIREQLR